MSVQSIDELVIRTATNADRERATALIFGVLSEFGLPPEPQSKDADLADIEKNYLKRGGSFELIEDRAGNLVGTVGLFPLDEESCELRKMYFVPRVRGLGLGSRILERTIAYARASGFKRIRLETVNVLQDAIRLYKRHGFVPAATTHLSARCDQAYVLELQQ
jgi:putative acetyltransferase